MGGGRPKARTGLLQRLMKMKAEPLQRAAMVAKVKVGPLWRLATVAKTKAGLCRRQTAVTAQLGL